MDVLTSVKLAIYEDFAATAQAPNLADLAARLRLRVDEVQHAYAELQEKRLLVREPDDPTRIRMAPPFSNVPTDFKVTVKGKSYFAPCVWDSIGISAALHEDGMVRTHDGHTRESMNLVIRDGAPKPTPCVIHIAVPAAHWWDDIIYT